MIFKVYLKVCKKITEIKLIEYNVQATRKEAREEGIEKGRYKKAIEVAKN